VDGLERKAGLAAACLMECHGSMDTFRCTGPRCTRKRSLQSLEEALRAGQVCYCSCGEVLKPAVTFFGEQLPKRLFSAMGKDLPRCDLLLVIGTSLKVGGSVHEVLRGLPAHIPQVLINRDPVALPPALSAGFDVTLLGQCDDIARYLCDRLDWGSLDAAPAADAVRVSVPDTSAAAAAVLVSAAAAAVLVSAAAAGKVDPAIATKERKRKRKRSAASAHEQQQEQQRLAAHRVRWACVHVPDGAEERLWSVTEAGAS